MNAAHKAILSVHHTTAVVLARTPDYIDRSRQIIDQARFLGNTRILGNNLKFAVFFIATLILQVMP